jgi:hypothetical protein
LSAAIAESDIDDAHRFEGVGGREIEACSLEFLFDGAMDEEGERGSKDVRLDSMVSGDRSAARRSRVGKGARSTSDSSYSRTASTAAPRSE